MTANSERDAERLTSRNTPSGSIPSDTFAARLVLARHFAGRLSIEQAAKMCGLNAGNWGHWEDGRRPRDQVDVCTAIATGLGVSREWLLFGGALSPSAPNRRVTKRTGETTLRYSPVAERPKDTRPLGRPVAGQARATTGPTPRRPVRISGLQVA